MPYIFGLSLLSGNSAVVRFLHPSKHPEGIVVTLSFRGKYTVSKLTQFLNVLGFNSPVSCVLRKSASNIPEFLNASEPIVFNVVGNNPPLNLIIDEQFTNALAPMSSTILNVASVKLLQSSNALVPIVLHAG